MIRIIGINKGGENTILSEAILKHKEQFGSLCQKHKVKYLYAFGSSVTEKFDTVTSDIDLMVEVDETDPLKKGDYLLSLWDNFEAFFHRKVDLLTDSSVNNPYLRKSIEATKILIYDGTRAKILI